MIVSMRTVVSKACLSFHQRNFGGHKIMQNYVHVQGIVAVDLPVTALQLQD